MEELEETLSRLKEETSDKAKLLESIQSDKATISRALAQNKELKTQLEELQTAFVKMVSPSATHSLGKMFSERKRVLQFDSIATCV